MMEQDPISQVPPPQVQQQGLPSYYNEYNYAMANWDQDMSSRDRVPAPAFPQPFHEAAQLYRQSTNLMTGSIARRIWRTTLSRSGRGELRERQVSGLNITEFRRNTVTCSSSTTSHHPDQEGLQKHHSDLGTLSSPNTLYLYLFSAFVFIIYLCYFILKGVKLDKCLVMIL